VISSIVAVIPTRNRPVDLCKAVASILNQKRLPEALMIVDQSEGDESVDAVNRLFENETEVELIYVHDNRISGLVEAKKVASEISNHDIVCFLEDDVVLEPAYIGNIELGFVVNEEMLGCSGVITNQPNQSGFYRLMHAFFFRGIFEDPRVQIFGPQYADDKTSGLVLCDVLSGGLSAWRREVLLTIPFDVENEFFMFEDIEYSTRVVKEYGHKLYINRKARLEHHMAARNRDPHGYRQQRKLKEAVLFYKKRKDWPGARVGLLFSMLWWQAEAAFQSVKNLSPGPYFGYWRGVFDGISRKLV
jgi:GT2 family glycosyltransferase